MSATSSSSKLPEDEMSQSTAVGDTPSPKTKPYKKLRWASITSRDEIDPKSLATDTEEEQGEEQETAVNPVQPKQRGCGPTRYVLARLCLIPLSLLSGGCVVLAIVSLPLTSGNTPFVAVEALNMAIYVFVTFWAVLQAATISHDHLIIHEVRVWTWTLSLLFAVHLAIFVSWAAITRPTASCPILPACEYSLGGYCSAPDLAIYNLLLVCQVNWGLLGGSIAVLSLELAALVMLLIMRILPAMQNPEKRMWYGSIYTDYGVQWRFEPIKLSQLGLGSGSGVGGGKSNGKPLSPTQPSPEAERLQMMQLREGMSLRQATLDTDQAYDPEPADLPQMLVAAKGKQRDPLNLFQ